jgi:hypothetical protein
VTGRRGRVEPYSLAVRPLPPSGAVSALVDLRTGDPWNDAIAYLQDVADGLGSATVEQSPEVDVIKPFERRRGADVLQLDRTIAALDAGWPVAFYGWWPIEAAAVTTDILGVDAMEVPPPDRKRTTLADGHAVVLIGYGRHDSFPGGGYVIVRNCWRDWGDDGDGYMPFTFVRTYATELRAYRFPGSRRAAGGGGPSRADRPAAGSPRLPAVVPQLGRRTTTDAHIDRHARCADQRASLTHLFFSDDMMELARARAICSMCEVRQQCLVRALERQEPYGIWGGEMVIDGQAVADKRGRGRPPKRPPPRLVVDEITGVPIVA